MDITNEKKEYLPCFLCGKKLRIKQTKNEKPYFICDPCGLQVFVRCKAGIRELNRLIRRMESKSSNSSEILNSSFEVISLTSRIAQLRAKLKHIEDNELMWGTDTESEIATKAIKAQMREIESELKRISNA
jgi:predicted RNA-binding Zn-ribbon protein involved in translation (DUF1610 family)